MKILVCHDGSEVAQSALEKTVVFFKWAKPQIVVATVAEEPADASSYDEAAFEEERTKREDDLKKAANWVMEHGLDVDAILAVGDPRKMLLETVARKNPDLVVVASRPPATGIRFGNVAVSVSDYLIRHITDRPGLVMQ